MIAVKTNQTQKNQHRCVFKKMGKYIKHWEYGDQPYFLSGHLKYCSNKKPTVQKAFFSHRRQYKENPLKQLKPDS